MNIGGWFVLGLIIFAVFFLFCMMICDDIKIRRQMKIQKDMEYVLHDMNILMYYDRTPGVEFNPFICDKIFIRIFESRDGYTKFEKQVFSQSYDKTDKLKVTCIDVMKSMDLYNMLKSRGAKLIKDYKE